MLFSVTQKAIFGLAFCLLIFDRLAKIISLNLLDDQTITLFPQLQLSLSLNPHIAFSLPLSGPALYISLALALITLLYCWLFFYQARLSWALTWLSVINLGALSNLCDRLFYGSIIDYLHLQNFTVFNLADCLISLGSLGLGLFLLKHPQPNKH